MSVWSSMWLREHEGSTIEVEKSTLYEDGVNLNLKDGKGGDLMVYMTTAQAISTATAINTAPRRSVPGAGGQVTARVPVLLPCPFCGGTVQALHHYDDDGLNVFRVMCHGCLIQTAEYRLRAVAVKRWNRRAK